MTASNGGWVQSRAVDRHDVGVADEGEALGVRVAAGQAGDQVGPVGLARDELALDPGLAEVVGQVPRDERLVAGCVAGVEADEVAREGHDLLVEIGHGGTLPVGGGRAQSRLSTASANRPGAPAGSSCAATRCASALMDIARRTASRSLAGVSPFGFSATPALLSVTRRAISG